MHLYTEENPMNRYVYRGRLSTAVRKSVNGTHSIQHAKKYGK